MRRETCASLCGLKVLPTAIQSISFNARGFLPAQLATLACTSTAFSGYSSTAHAGLTLIYCFHDHSSEDESL
jgi:hypothetical protein